MKATLNGNEFEAGEAEAEKLTMFRLWLNSQEGGNVAVKLEGLTTDLNTSTEALRQKVNAHTAGGQ